MPKAFIKDKEDWDKVTYVSEAFSTNDTNLQFMCVLNSTNDSEELNNILSKTKRENINVHIWSKYEIENYTINSDVILRYIDKFKRKGNITKKTLLRVIEETACSLYDRGKPYSTLSNLLDAIPGRAFFYEFSKWTQDKFGITITPRQLVPYFKINEVPEEIKKLIVNIMDIQRS